MKRVLFMCIIGVILLLGFCWWKIQLIWANDELLFVAAAEKTMLLPGEPCAVELTFKNHTTKEMRMDLGADGTEHLWFEIFDRGEQRICQSRPIRPSGLSGNFEYSISPGGTAQHRAVLNQWCSTLLPPGNYTGRAYLRIQETTKRANFSFSIAPMDEQALKNIFAKLAEKVLEKHALQENFFAARMLFHSRSPLAVDALLRIVQHAPIMQFQNNALEALRGISTPKTIQIFVEIVTNNTKKEWGNKRNFRWMKSFSIDSVKIMCRNEDNESIREICQTQPVQSIVNMLEE